MPLTAKNLLVNLLYYSTTVVALPYAFLMGEKFLGIPTHPSQLLRIGALLLGLLGAALQVWCIVLLQSKGKGTPSPLVPARMLVIAGPYRIVRNPLNSGELMVIVALAAWFGSLALVLYAFLAFAAFHLFVMFWEEPVNRRRFGDSYRAYEARVDRWWPRMPG